MKKLKTVKGMAMGKARNRIQIMNWRRHGDDESYCRRAAYSRLFPDQDIRHEIQHEIDPVYDWEQDGDAESREDWGHVYYVNDDFVIADGDVIEHNGRKFRVKIQEVQG